MKFFSLVSLTLVFLAKTNTSAFSPESSSSLGHSRTAAAAAATTASALFVHSKNDGNVNGNGNASNDISNDRVIVQAVQAIQRRRRIKVRVAAVLAAMIWWYKGSEPAHASAAIAGTKFQIVSQSTFAMQTPPGQSSATTRSSSSSPALRLMTGSGVVLVTAAVGAKKVKRNERNQDEEDKEEKYGDWKAPSTANTAVVTKPTIVEPVPTATAADVVTPVPKKTATVFQNPFSTSGNIQNAQQQPKPVTEEAKLAAKYAAIETLEERAYQIVVDLGMAEDNSESEWA